MLAYTDNQKDVWKKNFVSISEIEYRKRGAVYSAMLEGKTKDIRHSAFTATKKFVAGVEALSIKYPEALLTISDEYISLIEGAKRKITLSKVELQNSATKGPAPLPLNLILMLLHALYNCEGSRETLNWLYDFFGTKGAFQTEFLNRWNLDELPFKLNPHSKMDGETHWANKLKAKLKIQLMNHLKIRKPLLEGDPSFAEFNEKDIAQIIVNSLRVLPLESILPKRISTNVGAIDQQDQEILLRCLSRRQKGGECVGKMPIVSI